MSFAIDNLGYSISKRVTSMEDAGFSISTNYGDMSFEPEEARAIIREVRKLLERKLAKAEAVEAKRRELAKIEGGAL
ncbi:MAG: hypothetical protein EPO42_13335 [Gallionellaceae bacterium]|nr:MAG: hypothetical protein EPO42_13335 [Gallionellaceae bacterium]